MLIEFKGMVPDVSQAAYIAENATICGDVTLGKDSSVWFNAVIRAEVAPINVGEMSNVQDHTMLHADYDCPIRIGSRVSIGHSAIIHGATIEDRVIVGMGAIVMNGAVIGEGSIIVGQGRNRNPAVFVGSRRSGRCEEDAYTGRTSPGKQ